MANPLVINAAELLRRPGNERDVEMSVTQAELDVDDAHLAADAEVDVHLHLESLSDGIVVTGAVAAPWSGTCRRCLTPAAGVATAEVHELYQHTVTDPDAFELIGDQLDLRPMVRELLLLELPETPVCREDCAGLCPQCGVDRNTTGCECTVTETDPRWDALAALRTELE
ncbi:MAG: DUF177 domain-containing protein [Ilumatobacteraceae bacterium]